MDNGFLNTSVEACYHYMWIYRFYFVYSDFLPALNMDLSPVRPSPLSSYLWQEIKKHSFYSCSYNWSLLSLNWCVFIELMVWLLNFWFFIDPKPLLPPPPPFPFLSSYMSKWNKKHFTYSYSYHWGLLSLNWCVVFELFVWLLNSFEKKKKLYMIITTKKEFFRFD